MKMLKNKYDFVAIISVANANPNGDPLNENKTKDKEYAPGDGRKNFCSI